MCGTILIQFALFHKDLFLGVHYKQQNNLYLSGPTAWLPAAEWDNSVGPCWPSISWGALLLTGQTLRNHIKTDSGINSFLNDRGVVGLFWCSTFSLIHILQVCLHYTLSIYCKLTFVLAIYPADTASFFFTLIKRACCFFTVFLIRAEPRVCGEKMLYLYRL